jgi:D-serine deaminase-like pyridoxal phosphate-dependent protein
MKNIVKPTLLLNKARAIQNIERMLEKAHKSRVRFRPHFKTHQSAIVGDWFKQRGVESITVSSLDMAWYFAQYGWKDILVAFPVNVLEIDKINALVHDIHLHLLVESLEAVWFLEERLIEGAEVSLWIKIDTGYQRTGLEWHQFDHIIELARRIADTDNLKLRGVLTHAGQTYRARSKGEVESLYRESVSSMRVVLGQLGAEGFEEMEISIGDTPSCSIVRDLSDVDEIRPGNFVFYDVMQLAIRACEEHNIAVAVACPVVAKHPQRNEFVIYGGAVHLSKETISVAHKDGATYPIYGYVASPILKSGQELSAQGWGARLDRTAVTRLSQEHGIVQTTKKILREIKIGDIVLVLPVHSCLAANLLRKYTTLEGEVIALGAFA